MPRIPLSTLPATDGVTFKILAILYHAKTYMEAKDIHLVFDGESTPSNVKTTVNMQYVRGRLVRREREGYKGRFEYQLHPTIRKLMSNYYENNPQ